MSAQALIGDGVQLLIKQSSKNKESIMRHSVFLSAAALVILSSYGHMAYANDYVVTAQVTSKAVPPVPLPPISIDVSAADATIALSTGVGRLLAQAAVANANLDVASIIVVQK